MVGLDATLIRKYGLPTAFAVAAFAAFVWLVRMQVEEAKAQRVEIGARVLELDKRIESLGKDVDFLSRIVDDRCAERK
jgi:hypothetical protein